MDGSDQRERFLEGLFGPASAGPAAGRRSTARGPALSSRPPLAEIPLVFVDVETTGLSPWTGDRVCEIAAVRFAYGRETGRLATLVNPERRVSPGALAVNGLDESELARAPRFAAIADDLASMLEGASIVAHNAPFDAGFLAREFTLNDQPVPDNHLLDTLLLARRTFHLRSNSLGSLASALGIRTPAHRALADVLTTRELFERIVARLATTRPTLGDVLRAQGGALSWARR